MTKHNFDGDKKKREAVNASEFNFVLCCHLSKTKSPMPHQTFTRELSVSHNLV